jgi:small subunit ribosomal protein S18
MSKKLFVSNLDFEVDTVGLEQMFAEMGAVVSVVIATDRETRRSKGFGFVEMETEEAASQAIEGLNNRLVNGRPIKVVADRGKTGVSSEGSEAGGDGQRKFEPLPAIQRTQLFKKKKRLDPFMEDPSKTVNYKDVAVIGRFISERGKILGRRHTGLSAFNQRQASKAIKRAQHLGLLPFSPVSK